MFNNLLKKKVKDIPREITTPAPEQLPPQSSNMIKVINNLQAEISHYKREIKGKNKQTSKKLWKKRLSTRKQQK